MLSFLTTAFLSDKYQTLRFQTGLLLYVLVLVIGNLPGARADAAELASGLVLHSCCYAFLALLLFSGRAGTPARRALTAVLMVAVLGALDEYVQTFFPYRHGQVSDWVVDCCAASVTALVLWPLWPRLRQLPRAAL